jgi:hypothetical protein
MLERVPLHLKLLKVTLLRIKFTTVLMVQGDLVICVCVGGWVGR